LIKSKKTEENDTISSLTSVNSKIKDKKPLEGKVEGGKPKKKSDI